MLSLFGIGQSNEQGSGQTAGCNRGFGSPILDPTKPRGSNRRSWYPSMARVIGQKKRMQCAVFNYAVGTTSFIVGWTGIVTPWFSGIKVMRGLYVISDGGLWKSNQPADNVWASTVAPIGTTSVIGTDSLSWTYLRPATFEDTRHVCKPGDPLFDPNGYLAAMSAAIPEAPGKKVLLVSTGQGDASTMYPLTTGDDFRDAYIFITQYALSKGIHEVYLGFTCYLPPEIASIGSLITARYTEFTAGVEAALQYFSGNLQVKRGVNLWQELGDIPTTTDSTKIGLHDGLHLNDAAYEEAGRLWANCILT